MTIAASATAPVALLPVGSSAAPESTAPTPEIPGVPPSPATPTAASSGTSGSSSSSSSTSPSSASNAANLTKIELPTTFAIGTIGMGTFVAVVQTSAHQILYTIPPGYLTDLANAGYLSHTGFDVRT